VTNGDQWLSAFNQGEILTASKYTSHTVPCRCLYAAPTQQVYLIRGYPTCGGYPRPAAGQSLVDTGAVDPVKDQCQKGDARQDELCNLTDPRQASSHMTRRD
jgi:hypothetical protein